ncbi:MAG TPA: helix-hairpin-helix domain-containing protein [Nocardioidaceae bacterium]|nr:helix-hairpin-helix domain-containing protein [Nocardioidaceae bacterium]
MPRPLRRRDRPGSASVAQQRLVRLADQLAAQSEAGTSEADQRADEPPPDVRGRHRAESLPAGRLLTASVADRLPATALRLRAEHGVSGQHVTVMALAVAALVALGAWWVVLGEPGEPTAVAPVVTAADEPSAAAGAGDAPHAPAAELPYGAPATGSDPSEPAATGEPAGPTEQAGTAGPASAGDPVVVDVTGKVRTPGLVSLPAGSRVADALEAAGGTRPAVDVTALNLARPVLDGEQILVGVPPARWPPQPAVPAPASPGAPAAPASPAAAPVNLNTATLEQLDTLPGIGPVTGQAILDWRAANGAFTSVDELLEVDGIGDVTLADLRDQVTV